MPRVDLIERVGSYVGMVSFLGLAILALLYFSQARDVRRLRDWAGRAPERAVELERTPTEPAKVVPPALPASQHSLPATPFSETAVRKRRPLRERLRNVHIPQTRYLALSVAGLLVLGGAAYGAVELIGGQNDSEPAKSAQGNSGNRKSSGDRNQRQVNVDPSRVTVAILNGTTVQGLAAKVGEEVARRRLHARDDRERGAHRPEPLAGALPEGPVTGRASRRQPPEHPVDHAGRLGQRRDRRLVRRDRARRFRPLPVNGRPVCKQTGRVRAGRRP